MRCRYFYQAKLVAFFINLLLYQLVVGEEFKIAFDLPAIYPRKGIEPLKDQYEFRNQNIKGVFLPDMNFFMQQDLVIRFPFIFFGVDKNNIAKGAGCFITAYFHYPVFTIDDNRVAVSTPDQ